MVLPGKEREKDQSEEHLSRVSSFLLFVFKDTNNFSPNKQTFIILFLPRFSLSLSVSLLYTHTHTHVQTHTHTCVVVTQSCASLAAAFQYSAVTQSVCWPYVSLLVHTNTLQPLSSTITASLDTSSVCVCLCVCVSECENTKWFPLLIRKGWFNYWWTVLLFFFLACSYNLLEIKASPL